MVTSQLKRAWQTYSMRMKEIRAAQRQALKELERELRRAATERIKKQL